MIGRFARRGHQDPEPEETPRDQLRREPLPVARAILWKPLPDSYHLLASMMRAPEQQAQLFVSQRAFLQVERHLQSAPDFEVGGFLAGHLCECPRSRTRYSVVNTVVPFADVTGDPIGACVTQKAFDTVRRRLDAHRLALIGWYRNGNGLGLQLLPDDIDTHLAYFNEPWQTTMIVVPDPSKPKGAFFTYNPRVGRGYCIPFYELFDEHAAEAKRLDRTCVSWATYVPSAPVQPLAAGDREVVETTVSPVRSEPEPQPSEPIDEWLEAIKDPWVRLKDVTVGSSRREPNDTPVIPPPAPPAQPKVTPRAEGTRPAPPFAGTARPAVRPPAVPKPPLEADRPRPVQSEIPPAREAPRPRPRPSPPKARPVSPPATAAMLKASTPPAFALPPDFHAEAIRWQRRRRLGFAVAGASFLAAIVLSSIRSRSETVAQAATTSAVSEATASPIVMASENGHAPVSLPLAVDSLSSALSYYRVVAEEHRAGRVSCRLLHRAYTLVDRARARVDSTRPQVTGHLSDADSIRVSMLGAEYTYVVQTHRRSGC